MNFDALTWDGPLYGGLMVLTDLFLKGLLILVGARLLTALLAKSAAAARHLVWATALLMILLLPLFSTVLPQVNLPLIEQPFQSVVTSESPRVAGQLASADKLDLASPAMLPETRSSGRQVDVVDAAGIRSERSAPAEWASRSVAPLPNTLPSADEGGRLGIPYIEALAEMHWTSLVVGLWIVGVLFVVGWTVVGLSGAWWITRSAKEIEDDDWVDLGDELADRLMIYRPVRLLTSTSISSPMTWGIWRPVILLPVDADDWSPERRRYVLLHEMAHIKRWDTLTQLGAQMSCALHWFNPLAWKSLHRMRIEQEKATDDLVLAHCMKASEYARHLLDIARSLKMPWVSPLNTISMAKPSQLEGRVVDILDPERNNRTLNRFGSVLTCVLALTVMLPLSALSPWMKPANLKVQAEVTLERAVLNEAAAPLLWDDAIAPEPSRTASPTVTARNADRAVRVQRVLQENELNWKPAPVVADTSEKQRRARKMAIEALRKSLEDENPDIRRQAAMTLGEMRDEGSIDALIKLLQTDSNVDVRRYAIAALVELDTPKAIDAYRIALDDKDKEIRKYAAMALSEQSDEAAVDALTEMLDDEDAEIRMFAVAGLAENGGDRVNDLLVKMLDDEHPEVRRQALIGLADRGDREALPGIRRALNDRDPEIRSTAVMALSEYDDQESLGLLREALEDPDREVRRHALMVIVDREDKESLPILINLLQNDSDPEVRKYAAMALGEIGDVDAVEALTKALEDDDVEVRRYAAMALSQLDYGDSWQGDAGWEDVQDWEDNEDREEDGDEWGAAVLNGGEDLGDAIARVGISAGNLGMAIGEISVNLTANVLDEITMSLDKVAMESNLSGLEQEVSMSQMELQEKIQELELRQHDLEQEWSEESYEAMLEALDALAPVLYRYPDLCNQATQIYRSRDGISSRYNLTEKECQIRKRD